MKEAEKGVVLNRLYIAMKEALSDSCHGIYDSYYKKELKGKEISSCHYRTGA